MSAWLEYRQKLDAALRMVPSSAVDALLDALFAAWQNRKQVFLCGNGGSAGNALHLANDFLYGINPNGVALRANALSANGSVMTCLSNDVGYDQVFAGQLRTLCDEGDLLIVMSGSGNSPSILCAINMAHEVGAKVSGILGYDGGKALPLVDIPVHVPIMDMQISEDFQLVVGHYVMRQLKKRIAHSGEVL